VLTHDALALVFGLLEGKAEVVEVAVQLLVGVVDAQLLKANQSTSIHSWPSMMAAPLPVHFEIFKSKNVEDTNKGRRLATRISLTREQDGKRVKVEGRDR
jgi:hypothetical protein